MRSPVLHEVVWTLAWLFLATLRLRELHGVLILIEALLEGLVDLFPSDLLQSYDGCTYSFPWEPYLSYHRDQQKEATPTQLVKRSSLRNIEIYCQTAGLL